jgi:hypothetical protein
MRYYYLAGFTSISYPFKTNFFFYSYQIEFCKKEYFGLIMLVWSKAWFFLKDLPCQSIKLTLLQPSFFPSRVS